MKKTLLLILISCLVSCGSDQKNKETSEENQAVVHSNNSIATSTSREDDSNRVAGSSRLVSRFLRDITSIETDTSPNPIVAFSESAKQQATEVIELNKQTAVSIFKKAEDYKYCIIVSEDHTIVKITDFIDCQASGSWGTCMPKAKGYIKKGEMQFQEDFVNNIIGRPDSGSHTVFLFK